MQYKILYTHSYNKKAKKFVKQHPELISQYEKTLKLLELNPFHPSLRLYKLKGHLKELHSVSINISYRIVIVFIVHETNIVPVTVGPHDTDYL